jgi:hypothetical protein
VVVVVVFSSQMSTLRVGFGAAESAASVHRGPRGVVEESQSRVCWSK